MSTTSAAFTCRLCGTRHTAVRLARGREACCIRCGTTLARRSPLGPSAGLACGVAALVLAVPAVTLPFVVVSRVGAPREATAWAAVTALWEQGMPFLAGWTALCGFFAPLALLLGLIAAQLNSARQTAGPLAARATQLTHVMEAWAMPEVYVLAVLVAFVRVETLADVTLAPGFWCYSAAALLLMVAWRSFDFDPQRPELRAA